jgi:integrase
MASSSGAPRLSMLAPAAVMPADPLPLAERAAYQRELVEAFLTGRRATVGPAAVHHTLSALRANFLPWLEARGRYVWEATPEDLDRWALSLKHSVKTRAHQQYFIQVELFYEWLVARRSGELRRRFGVEVRNPVDCFNRARRMPEDERLVPVPREEAIAFFLAAARARIDAAVSDVKWLQACRNFALWMLFNWAGLRRMEAAALVRDDVDLVAGTLRVREGKGGEGRLVHVQPPLAPVLRWYLHDVRPQAPRGWRVPLVFLNARGEALHPDGIRNLLHAEQVAARLPPEEHFTCHGFRRAYATRLYKALRQQGFRDPLVYVKEQLGHAYLSTTQRYCQLDDDYRFFLVRDAAVALTRHYATVAGGEEGGP